MPKSSDETGNPEPLLGVIGGMGPEATVQFLDKVIAATPAERDQDHVETIAYNDPNIPDRNDGILRDGQSPLPRLRQNATRLEEFGADVLAIPCNTAHYYYDDIANEVDAHVVNMIAEVRKRLEQSNVNKAGLLATSTVMDVGVYRDEFKSSPIELIHPQRIDHLMDAIYAIKRGNKKQGREKVNQLITEFTNVDAVITGCTELSVVCIRSDAQIVDPTTILAESCVKATHDSFE